MELTVRKIFTTLIGTIVLIVVMSLVIEMVNISLTGIQLQQTARLGLNQSANLFAQETYKSRDDGTQRGGSVDMADILASDGTVYVSGRFYGSGDVAEIYKKLYSKDISDEFSDWVKDVGTVGNWKSINLLNQYLNGSFSITTMPDYTNYANTYPNSDTAYNKYESDMNLYSDYIVAKSYVDSYMTPLNFGVPYMDEDVLQSMFRWNITELYSNCNSNMIVQDEYGNYCVRTGGFRIYTNQARITNIDYKIYDTNKTDEKEALRVLIHMEPDALGFSDDTTYLGVDTDERKRVCIIGIEYSIPVSYEGITPLKNIFSYVWDTEVEGYNNNYNRTNNQHFNTATAEMLGGGFKGNTAVSGVLPVPGKLIYYIVR